MGKIGERRRVERSSRMAFRLQHKQDDLLFRLFGRISIQLR